MAFETFAFDRCKFTTATTGTGTITVGPAVSGFRTPAGASVPDGAKLSLFIFDGGDWEDATGTYTASGTTLTRTLRYSSTGALLNLSGSATVVVTPGKDDFDFLLKRESTLGNMFLAGSGNFTATGTSNLAIGPTALQAVGAGVNNIAIGVNSQQSVAGGSGNSSIGLNSLLLNTAGQNNVALGSHALYVTTGSTNIAIGGSSGQQLTSGSGNTIIGGSSDGANGPTTGSNNILIGYDVDLPSNTASNQVGIGNIIFGTGVSGTGTSYLGAIGIGTPAPDRRFHVEEDTATTNAVNYLARLTATSSGTPAVNLGVGMEFEIETAAGNNEVGATIEAKATNVGSGTEAVVLDGKQMSGGALQETFGISFLMKALTGNVAYNNVATTVQPWFPGGGAFSLEASTSYEFEGILLITNGGTTHTTQMSFAGTATLTSIAYQFEAARVAVGATGVAPTMGFIAAATAVTLEAATSTALGTTVRVRGIVRVNAAGTFIPSFAFITNAPGAGNVLANTFFKLRKIGSNTVAAQGPVT